MRFPTKDEAHNLLKKYNVPQNIIEHSEAVARLALSLGKKFNEQKVGKMEFENLELDRNKLGQKVRIVDLELIESLALLHDITKMQELKQQKYVEGLTEDLLKEEGFGEFGRIAENLGLGSIVKKPLGSWEEKIVYYADKRIVQNEVVTLAERFEYFRERYGKINKEALENINKAWPLAEKLEKEIIKKMGVEEL